MGVFRVEQDPKHQQPSVPSVPRIAVYAQPDGPPDVVTVEQTSFPGLIEETIRRTHELAAGLGGRVPVEVIREVVENLVHANFADCVISVLDQGNTLRVADRGPGIAEKERALLPGFSTPPGDAARTLLRGVGSGLPFARAALRRLGGDLEVEDNLGGGTVVTLRVPGGFPEGPPESASGSPPETVRTSERQLKILLVLLELGKVGPTGLARELRMSSSTAFRDLVRLETLGLVTTDQHGLRSLTRHGLAHVEAVL